MVISMFALFIIPSVELILTHFYGRIFGMPRSLWGVILFVVSCMGYDSHN